MIESVLFMVSVVCCVLVATFLLLLIAELLVEFTLLLFLRMVELFGVLLQTDPCEMAQIWSSFESCCGP